MFRTVGRSPVAERVADAQERVYGPVLTWSRRTPLHTDALGHPLHPMLTDVVIGSWLSATVLDLVGGPGARRSATVLVATGLVAGVPTAVAGAADWSEMSGAGRRVGAVHALGTDVATFLFLGSLVARLRDRRAAGVGLALAGDVVVTVAGLLGGHLALRRTAAAGGR